MNADASAPDLAQLYRNTRERLTALVAGLDEQALATPVPACPGWQVQDVVAHLAAIVEDALAGRLTGPPSEAETAVQVARYKGRPMLQTLDGWLLQGLRTPVPVRITVEDAEFRIGPSGDPVLGLRTTRFEAFRWRMGRRSRDQLAALDWSGDPAPVLDHLVVFGPARTDIIE